MFEDMRGLDECSMGELGTLDVSEKTVAILRVRWWPQAAKQEEDKTINIKNIFLM